MNENTVSNELAVVSPTTAGALTNHSSLNVLGLGANIEISDIRLPRIELTQALSASVQDGTHKQGTLINSLTKQELATPVEIIPVFVTKSAIRWKPRSEGGGIIYKTDNLKDPTIAEDVAWHGDEKPKATVYINVVCRVKGEAMPLVASFCNTSQKVGFNLLSMIAMSGCAWNYKYVLSSVKKQNNQGSFFVFEVRMAGVTTAEEKADALTLYKQVSTMRSIDTDYEGDTTAPSNTSTDGVNIAQGQPEEF